MKQSTVIKQVRQYCDAAIQKLYQANVRPDVALLLLDARMLLLHSVQEDAWDVALASLVKEHAIG